MKVYIVTEGSYSDYHIDSVFTDLEQAQLRVATMELGEYADCPQVEEYDTDTVHYEGKLETVYNITYNPYTGEILRTSENKALKGYTPKVMPVVKIGDKSIRVNCENDVFIVAESEDVARKIFYDRFEQVCYKTYVEEGNRVIEELNKE